MRILLDECLPATLRHHLPDHEVFTVAFMKWKGIKNGQLLQLAASESFDVFLTTDHGIPYQQNPAIMPISVLIVRARSNSRDDLVPLMPLVVRALNDMPAKSIRFLP